MIRMANLKKRTIYLVGLSSPERDDLHARLVSSAILPEYFDAPGPCLEVLAARPCHLLVLSLDGRKAEELQLFGDSGTAVACIPKLVLVDHGDIPAAVQAIKAGAADCLERPLTGERNLVKIAEALREANHNGSPGEPALTPTETTVLHLLLEGKTNGETARTLHRSPRTVEVHRKHIMHKLRVTNIVELVKKANTMGLWQE